MKRILLLLLIGLLVTSSLPAQSVGINSTGNSPDPSAILDVQSTTQGMLVPRMTSAQRQAISNPANGLLVYDLNTQSFWFRAASVWTELVTGNLDRLADADGNTQIQVEEGLDDNTIRFDVDGSEAMVLNPDGSLTIRGDNPDDGGFLSLYNGDSTYFLRMFGGRLNDTAPLFNWQDGTALRFASSNEDYSGFAEHMRLTSEGNLGLGTVSPQASLHVEEGAVLLQGTYDELYAGPLPATGSGTRAMWIPEKAAFRVGGVTTTQWDLTNIGGYSSVAGGLNNTASGLFSFVGGGDLNTALGFHSFVGGGREDTTWGSFSSIVGGSGNTAYGNHSFIGGGTGNDASGNYSFMGGGIYNTAPSFGEAVFGLFAETYTPVFANAFDPTDRLFVVGNGTSFNARSNALTILKNGRTGLGTSSPQAKLHVEGGQILMRGDFVPNYSGAIPDSGAGTRLMWIPEKAAFRVGSVNGTQWDLANVGDYSSVMGGGNNNASGSWSFVGGGSNNWVQGDYSAVVGGSDNTASDNLSSVVGGFNNTASGPLSFVGGGSLNEAQGDYSAVVGGASHEAIGNASFIGGGGITIEVNGQSIFGGINEITADGYSSFIGGGSSNLISGNNSFIGGGLANTASGHFSFVGGGIRNTAPSFGEAVLGLYPETYTPVSATAFEPADRLFVVGNGTATTARSNALTILKDGKTGIGTSSPQARLHVENGEVLMEGTWGVFNYPGPLSASGAGTRLMWIPGKAAFRAGRVNADQWDLNKLGDFSAVVGGEGNEASGNFSFVGGGSFNTTSGAISFVGAGKNNTAGGDASFVGGIDNWAINEGEVKLGTYSVASTSSTLFSLGNGDQFSRSNALTILDDGRTVIGGSDPGSFRLKVIQTGAFGINLESTNGDGWELFVDNSSGELELWSNGQKGVFDDASGVYTALSDARLKTAVTTMPSVMDRVMQLRPSQYQYKQDARGRQYLGFIAQEVEPLFPELVRTPDSDSERESWYTMDYSGFGIVAIKAIQEQQQVIEAQQAEIEALKAQLQTLESFEARLTQLAQSFEAMEAQLSAANKAQSSVR